MVFLHHHPKVSILDVQFTEHHVTFFLGRICRHLYKSLKHQTQLLYTVLGSIEGSVFINWRNLHPK